MTKEEALKIIEKLLEDYAAYHVDWEQLEHDKNYTIEYPQIVYDAREALKVLHQ